MADACARLGVHPHGEASWWTWPMVIAKRRQDEGSAHTGVWGALVGSTMLPPDDGL